MVRKVISIIFIVVLLMAVTALPITAGQFDDFENGTTQDWSSGSQNPNRPFNVSTSGPVLGTYGDTAVVLKIVSATPKFAAELTGATVKAAERCKNARRERFDPSILPGTSLFFCMRGLLLHCQFPISDLRFNNRQSATCFHQSADCTVKKRLRQWHKKNNCPLGLTDFNRQSIGFPDVLMTELALKINFLFFGKPIWLV